MQSPYWRGLWLGTVVGALVAAITITVLYVIIRWETSRELVLTMFSPQVAGVAIGVALVWLIAYPLAHWMDRRRTASRRHNG